MTDSPNYSRNLREIYNAKRVATSIQRALVACDNAMQDDMIDTLHHARDEGEAAKVNAVYLLVFLKSHSGTKAYVALYRDQHSEGKVNEHLLRSPITGNPFPEISIVTHLLILGCGQTQPSSLVQPWLVLLATLTSVLIQQPNLCRLWILAPPLSVRATISVFTYCLRPTLSRHPHVLLSSAIWGQFTPFFLRSRTSTASIWIDLFSPLGSSYGPPT